MTTSLDCGGRRLDLRRAAIVGILNVTPDSFSDGGIFLARDAACRHAARMVEEGADMIDVGGESTRPGAQAVTLQEEMDRVVPVIEALRAEVDVPLSVDTSKPELMRAAVAAGAGVINDVMALRAPGALDAGAALVNDVTGGTFDPGMLPLVADRRVPVVLMHMQGEPRRMQENPVYGDVVADVRAFLVERVRAARAAGIDAGRLVVDPGFGFGKTVRHNFALLRGLEALAALGHPVLVGLSRKSMSGKTLDLPVDGRLHASVALAVLAVRAGARLVRVHAVRAPREAVRLAEAVYAERDGEVT